MKLIAFWAVTTPAFQNYFCIGKPLLCHTWSSYNLETTIYRATEALRCRYLIY